MEVVLVINNDSKSCSLIQDALYDCKLIICEGLISARKEIQSQILNAIILEITLPDGDGLIFLNELQGFKQIKSIPWIIVTAQNDIGQKVMAFGLECDDFVTMPFDPIELRARVKNKIRKSIILGHKPRSKIIGDLSLDYDQFKVYWNQPGKAITDLCLTLIEFKLIDLLSKRIGQIYGRAQILEQIWKHTFVSDRTVDGHIMHLRQKLKQTSVRIKTVVNVGYALSLWPTN